MTPKEKARRLRIAKAQQAQKAKVAKALSPEEMTKLSNIQSLLDELTQMGSGPELMDDPMLGEEPAMLAEEPMTEDDYVDEDKEEKEVKMILKTLENTPSESATASDGAEDRMDEVLPEESADNLSSVEKKLFKALLTKANKGVKKSSGSGLDQVLSKIVEIQKSSQTEMKELSTAFGNVLKGMGIVDQLDVAKAESDKNKPTQVNKGQNEELLAVLKSLQGGEVKKEEQTSQGNHVRKALNDRKVLSALVLK